MKFEGFHGRSQGCMSCRAVSRGLEYFWRRGYECMGFKVHFV